MSIVTNVSHPWHGVTYGKNAPEIVTGIIEIPKASRAKYEVDKATGLLKLDRVLYSSYQYPANYGFIPQTLGDDNDPLDILVLSFETIQPMCLVDAKVIGVMNMIDDGEGDEKIIAVANKDITVNHIDDICDIPQYLLNEYQNFFESYKVLENKDVIINGFGGKAEAFKIIEKAIALYKEKYPK